MADKEFAQVLLKHLIVVEYQEQAVNAFDL